LVRLHAHLERETVRGPPRVRPPVEARPWNTFSIQGSISIGVDRDHGPEHVHVHGHLQRRHHEALGEDLGAGTRARPVAHAVRVHPHEPVREHEVARLVDVPAHHAPGRERVVVGRVVVLHAALALLTSGGPGDLE
jgi:hypothetical protein